MPIDKIFYSACLGFSAGVLWRSLARLDLIDVICIGSIYLLLVFLFSIILKKDWDILISVFTIALVLGIARFQIADIQPPAIFEDQVNKTVSFSAMIVDEPARNASQTKLILETNGSLESATKITGDTKDVPDAHTEIGQAKTADMRIKTNTKTEKDPLRVGIVVFSKGNGGFHYGDLVKVTGKLEKPADFMTDQDMEFDYVDYLRKDGIFYTIHNPDIKILSSGHGNPIKRWLFSWRERFDTAIDTAIPSPESTVIGGIIIGERYAFSEQLRQIFMDTGTIHIVTIGGYHVTLVAEWIMKIFSFLPRFAGWGAGIVSIFLYVIVTGGAETSIRAGIMAALAIFATATGRTYASGRALVLAAIVMICINPFVLVYDISFDLSFMATIAIIFLSPRLEPYLEWIPWKWLRGIVTVTVSMYAFALPFVLYRIGNLSLVSLPANMAIVPLMPATMIAGFITGFAGLISPMLAVIPGKIAYTLLYYQIGAVALLARLPFAAVAIQNFSLPIVIAIYACFGCIFLKGDSKARKAAGAALGPQSLTAKRLSKLNVLMLSIPLIITFSAAGFLYYSHYRSDQASLKAIQKLLYETTTADPSEVFSSTSTAHVFMPNPRTASSDCKINGVYPDHTCTPGAVFTDATTEDVCVKGYTATVRNVSEKTKKQVFEEYGIAYPQPAGAYEVDHFIPLALGGANDIANLFPEAAAPTPGFHEKDVVEVFLQEEVCSGHAALAAAQRQISTDWLAVYENIPFEDIQKIKNKYGGSAVQ